MPDFYDETFGRSVVGIKKYPSPPKTGLEGQHEGLIFRTHELKF
jgi:hypothetical protein